jgi:hypothetical protein
MTIIIPLTFVKNNKISCLVDAKDLKSFLLTTRFIDAQRLKIQREGP